MERTAIYPGTFDPVTLGHLDIISRGARLFENVIVAVVVNREKTPLFTPDERVRQLQESVADLPNVEVHQFGGLLIDYVKEVEAHVIIRGLRAISDFENEFQMAAMNHQLDPEMETIFLMAGESTTFVSSRLIKEIAAMGGDVSKFVPAGVVPDLVTAIRNETS